MHTPDQSDAYPTDRYIIYDDVYQLSYRMEKATSFLTLSYAPMLFRILSVFSCDILLCT
jgi:hypothetical protein